MFLLGALKITVTSSEEALKDEFDLHSFLGLSNHYWQSITENSGLITPSMSTKKRKYISSEAVATFTKLKQVFTLQGRYFNAVFREERTLHLKLPKYCEILY